MSVKQIPDPRASMWRIWSHEHQAWWNPDRAGYTQSFNRAGLYTYDEAWEIVARANLFCKELPNEAMVQDIDSDQFYQDNYVNNED